MRRVDLAKGLVFANSAEERKRLIRCNPQLADKKLADAIRAICYSSWTTEPLIAQKAAAAIKFLAIENPSNEIRAAALWVAGIAAITKGRFERAASSLDDAVSILLEIDKPRDAAQAQVAQLLALAMLGRYDEAIATGKSALSVFLIAGDDLDAGKTAKNLSNILSRQMRHREALRYCRQALSHFIKSKEKGGQAMAENGLANTYAELNDFRRAEKYYERALTTSRAQKMLVTEAEIEASLGNLALLRGKYSEALKFLERSRQKYDQLAMPHQSAVADLEMADIYSELSLFMEASDIYARIAPIFMKLKMRGEEARTRLSYARSLDKLTKDRIIKRELNKARSLFESEKNSSGQASTLLAMAEFEIGHKHFKRALLTLTEASKLIENAENPRHSISLKLLKARALVGDDDLASAVEEFTKASKFARKHNQMNSLHSAFNGLGRISAMRGERAKARSFYSRSIEVVEGLRATLSTDEFSRSFLSSRLDSFNRLADLHLSEGRIADGFLTVERGRARSLLDSIHLRTTRSVVPKHLTAREREARAELNFYYNRLATSAVNEIDKVRSHVQRIEGNLASISRQIDSLATIGTESEKPRMFEIEELQRWLSGSQTLIEFIETGNSLAAFVVTGSTIEFVTGLGTVGDVDVMLDDLHFQFDSLRYGEASLSRFADQFKSRTDRILQQLYKQLLRPLEKHLAGDGLIIVPVGSLNYVPFHALHDGTQYILQRFEVGYAPSAGIWTKLQQKTPKTPRTALLVAYADEKIPLVEAEIVEIGKIFPKAVSLAGEAATVEAFFQNAAKKDIIHLACHGQFRPDNPMFSSLHLADGRVAVRDILAKKLDASLVSLSACETGRNEIFAGDEILGLARGFLTAGAMSLIVSLWNVNDAATSGLMSSIYSHLKNGETPGGSLRKAQIELIEKGLHPFFWSPFVKIGR